MSERYIQLSLFQTAEDVGCPMFQNDKIIQQPANFLNIEANYIYEATSFIKTQAGQLLSCAHVSWLGLWLCTRQCCLKQQVNVDDSPPSFIFMYLSLLLIHKHVHSHVHTHTHTASNSPFFLYMAFQHTHHPQFAGEKFTNTSIRGKFGDALNELDWGVGQILQTLKDAGVDKDTFVFFTSDNG